MMVMNRCLILMGGMFVYLVFDGFCFVLCGYWFVEGKWGCFGFFVWCRFEVGLIDCF